MGPSRGWGAPVREKQEAYAAVAQAARTAAGQGLPEMPLGFSLA